MRVNEIKEVKEIVVGKEYIAEDGTKFNTVEECKKYEESALFAVKSVLKNKIIGHTTEYDLLPYGNEDTHVTIYKIDTEEDLELLIRYLHLIDNKRNVDKLTYGHEIIVFDDYDGYIWTYGDGSLEYLINDMHEQYAKALEKGDRE